jgi:hypothetical protein
LPLAFSAQEDEADVLQLHNEERSMEKPENHGEGNPEAAERFNAAEQQFVKSKSGQQKIRDGAKVRSDEEAGLAEAEKIGREHAKSGESGGTKQK